jgi:hypothetical protein
MSIDVYAPFEHFVKLIASRLDSHPGTRMKIYSIREVVANNLSQLALGTWPFGGSVFEKSDFSSWGVTDR